MTNLNQILNKLFDHFLRAARGHKTFWLIITGDTGTNGDTQRELVVEQFIKPAILKVVDRNQYGTVPKSSTTHALISIVHNLAKETDGNGA